MKRFMGFRQCTPAMSLLAGRSKDSMNWAPARRAMVGASTSSATVPGLVALDPLHAAHRLTRPDPTFIYFLANPDLTSLPPGSHRGGCR